MSTLRLSLSLATLLATAATLHAADGSQASAGAARYELKKRSTFALAETTRPPFWPIGYVKQTGVQTQGPVVSSQPKAVLDERSFSVTSILLGHPSLAVINGRSYSEGETVRMPRGSARSATRPARRST